MSVSHVLVVASGAEVEPLRTATADVVICADGGVGPARRAGLVVDTVVGDLDSVDPNTLADARADGAEVREYSVDKDESDLELALEVAIALAPDHITVHAAAGGRLDHQIANLAVLASPRWSSASVDAVIGVDRVWVIRGERQLPVAPGAAFSLHAVGGPAVGVTSTGVAWPLVDESVDAFSARGIANRATGDVAVSVREGVLLATSST